MNSCTIDFEDQPRVTHVMGYGGIHDSRKDKYIRGMNWDYPRVRLVGVQARHGQLKVVCVQHTAPHRLHPNLLCNKGGVRGVNKDNYVDDCGTATFDLTNETGTVEVELKELCIRIAKRNMFEDIKKNWSKQQPGVRFDPLNLGFDDTAKEVNFHRVSLCCQAIFDDGSFSNVIVSHGIVNSKDKVMIQDWDENRRVNERGNERLYIPVCKLSSDQHKGDILRVRFSIGDNAPLIVKPESVHYESTIIVKIPSYTKITGESVLLEEVSCEVCIIVIGKDNYTSDSKEFTFFPRNYFSDNRNNDSKRRKKSHALLNYLPNDLQVAVQSTNIEPAKGQPISAASTPHSLTNFMNQSSNSQTLSQPTRILLDEEQPIINSASMQMNDFFDTQNCSYDFLDELFNENQEPQDCVLINKEMFFSTSNQANQTYPLFDDDPISADFFASNFDPTGTQTSQDGEIQKLQDWSPINNTNQTMSYSNESG